MDRFCTNCGTEFNEYGICPRCGRRRQDQEAGIPAAPPAVAKPKREKSGPGIFDYLKAMLRDPVSAVSSAGKSSNFTLLALAAATCFFVGASYSAGTAFTAYHFYNRSFLRTILLLFLVSLVFAGTIALFAILLKLLVCPKKSELSYMKLLNTVAFAFLPLGAVCSVAALCNLVYSPIGASIRTAGLFAGFLLVYVAVQKLQKFEKSPFLRFMLCTLITLTVLQLSVNLATGIAF